MFYIDPLYIILSAPALILAISAQLLVKYFFSKYSKTMNKKEMTGVDVAEKFAREYGLNLRLNVAFADLSDHYNPAVRELTLSERVARTPSIASVGITAHEIGHALQHKKGEFLVGLRTAMVPVVNFGTTVAYILFILGLSLQFFSLAIIAVALFSLSTIFTLVTLPIEIDASIKAMRMIRAQNILYPDELGGVKKVLIAASLTYVAGVLQSLSSLIYFVLRALGSRRE